MWPWQKGDAEIAEIGMTKAQLRDMEKTIGHKFKDKGLLITALSHPSRNAEAAKATNERLAWVGDAFLYDTISTYLFSSNPNASTSELHVLRERYKQNLDLAKMDSEGLKLSRFLITGKSREGQDHSPGMVATMVEAIIGAISIESPRDAKIFIERNIIKK